MAMVEINFRPDRRMLKHFGYVAFAGFGLLGALIWWRQGLFGFDFGTTARFCAWILWGLGGVSLLLSLIAPGANRPLYLLLVLLTYPLGWVLSHVVLAVVFIGVITPIGLLFRLIGRDPLRRRFDPQATSYWVPHRPAQGIERYFRQF